MQKNNTITLSSPVSDIRGIGPKKAEAFGRLGIEKLSDILELYPREYEDLRNRKKIFELNDGEKAAVTATVLLVRIGRGFGRKRTLHVLCEDNTGRMEVLLFNGSFLAPQFRQGTLFRFFGKVKVENGRVTMFHPSYTKADGTEEDGIFPVYPLTRGLTQKDLRLCSRAAKQSPSRKGQAAVTRLRMLILGKSLPDLFVNHTGRVLCGM